MRENGAQLFGTRCCRIWSREIATSLIFMIFDILGKSLHHQIPPNWSSDLQRCCPNLIRIFQSQTHTQLKEPPHPTPYGVFGNLLGVSIYLFGHGLAAAPGHGQVPLGTKKVARTWTGAGLGPGGPGPSATFFAPSATWPWPGAAARP